LKTSRDSIVNATNCGFNEENTGIGECDVVVTAAEAQRACAATQMCLWWHAWSDRGVREMPQETAVASKRNGKLETRHFERFDGSTHRAPGAALTTSVARYRGAPWTRIQRGAGACKFSQATTDRFSSDTRITSIITRGG
jgi:hypothetical protein